MPSISFREKSLNEVRAKNYLSGGIPKVFGKNLIKDRCAGIQVMTGYFKNHLLVSSLKENSELLKSHIVYTCRGHWLKPPLDKSMTVYPIWTFKRNEVHLFSSMIYITLSLALSVEDWN